MDAEQEYVTSGKVLLISEDKITFTQRSVIFYWKDHEGNDIFCRGQIRD